MQHPLIIDFQSKLDAYATAFAIHAKASTERNAMEQRLRSLTAELETLRARIVDQPDLATDAKTRSQLASLRGDHEMATAAVEGLTAKEAQARAIAGEAASRVTGAVYCAFEPAQKRRIKQRQEALLALMETWGPGAAGASFTLNPRELGAWCRHCVEAHRFSQTLYGYSEMKLIPPAIVQDAVDFLRLEFAELPPADEASAENQTEADLQQAA